MQKGSDDLNSYSSIVYFKVLQDVRQRKFYHRTDNNPDLETKPLTLIRFKMLYLNGAYTFEFSICFLL